METKVGSKFIAVKIDKSRGIRYDVSQKMG